jgi:hypothetical protein
MSEQTERPQKEEKPKVSLDVFLNPEPLLKTIEVVVSQRFKDATGQPVKWKLRSLSESDNERIVKASQKRVKGRRTDEIDRTVYAQKLLEACVLYPDCHDQTLLAHYGALQPQELFSKMLSVGEYADLSRYVLTLNGLGDDEENESVLLEEEVKN